MVRSSPSEETAGRLEAGVGSWARRLDARQMAILFRVLAGFTFALLIFGATVRVHGAGLSCPDWPLCLGHVVPELNFQVFLEWGHRVLAGTISIGFAGLGGWLLYRPELRARAGRLWAGALVVLMAQIVLGGLTVLQLLAYWSVTLHLLTGNLFLLCLLGIANVLDPRPLQAPPATRQWALALSGMWFLQMALGGLVSSNYAGLACTEWPTCNGGVWAPVLNGIVGLQLAHRAGAYVLFGLAAAFAVSARGTSAAGSARLVFGIVLAQVGLGVANVLLALPVEIAVLHSATADLIGITAVLTAMRLSTASSPAPVAT